MAALRSLDNEPWWMSEAETLRDRRDLEREDRLQQMEDEQPRPSYGTDTGGSEE